MTRDELLDLFRRSGALLEGHFRLSSGLHSRLSAMRARAAAPGGRGSARAGAGGAARATSPRRSCCRRHSAASIIGQEVGRALGVRAIFAERQEGTLMLRRGFALAAPIAFSSSRTW